ncbi:MAG: ATP-binding protein, partial [Alphaproteobacteria bacterium]|nr:ATP-binding protein [Alphaproteobacteria bacterium]
MMTALSQLALKHRISQTFTPSAPIDRYALFAGRTEQVEKLMNAVSQKGQHAILFGERGVGKTSLATVLKELLVQLDPTGNVPIGSTNCEATSTFQSIWKAILRDMPIILKEVGMGIVPTVHEEEGTFADVSDSINSAEDVRHLFESMKDKRFVIIIDEIDQIKTKGTAKSLADTIKTLSDHVVKATLVLVGVADSVDQLIAEHASIERALVQIKMERMSLEELHEIIDKGLKEVGMTAKDEAKKQISKLSQGLPHYTHLLALHAAQSAVSESRMEIGISDVENAISKA